LPAQPVRWVGRRPGRPGSPRASPVPPTTKETSP
jgi:hypothetical protein